MTKGMPLLAVLLKVTAKSMTDSKIFLDWGERNTEGFEISLKLLPSIVLKM